MTTRRSRFRREPIGQGYRITGNDVRILELLHRFRFLPSSYLTVFLDDRNELALRHRLTLLRHEAGLIDTPAASWQAANAHCRPAVYTLTRKGEQLLCSKRGLRPVAKGTCGFKHELLVALFHASIALGVRDQPNIDHIGAEDILGHPKFPEAQRRKEDPFRIPVRLRYTAPRSGMTTTTTTSIRHDGSPFGLRYRKGAVSRYLFFPGIEADRRTEPLSSERSDRTSIRKHLGKTLTAFESDQYRRHLGIPNALVPIVTTSPTHMDSMMSLLLDLTDGAGSPGILFKAMPDFTTFEGFPPTTGHMLTEPWQRAGHLPYDILRELKQAAAQRQAA